VDPEVRDALEGLRQDLDQRIVEIRRHFDVVGESLRAEIRAMRMRTSGGRTGHLVDDLEKARRRRKR
jgi:hypothetical protein